MEDCQEWSESSAAVLTLTPWERAGVSSCV